MNDQSAPQQNIDQNEDFSFRFLEFQSLTWKVLIFSCGKLLLWFLFYLLVGDSQLQMDTVIRLFFTQGPIYQTQRLMKLVLSMSVSSSREDLEKGMQMLYPSRQKKRLSNDQFLSWSIWTFISKAWLMMSYQTSNGSNSLVRKCSLKLVINTSSKKATQLKHFTSSFSKCSPCLTPLKCIPKFLCSSSLSNPLDAVINANSDPQTISFNFLILSQSSLWYTSIISPNSNILKSLYLSLIDRMQHLPLRCTTCTLALDFFQRIEMRSRSQSSSKIYRSYYSIFIGQNSIIMQWAIKKVYFGGFCFDVLPSGVAPVSWRTLALGCMKREAVCDWVILWEVGLSSFSFGLS